jgi:hypothetical protein
MHRFLLSLLVLALAAPALAQDDGPYVYASYLECDPTALADLTAAMNDDFAPALDAHVAAGDLTAWGWISHHTGGYWNRAAYLIAPTLDELMAFNDAWQDEMGQDLPEAAATLRRVCHRHEDYIWRVVATSRTPDEVGRSRPAAGASTYFRCNQGGLDRADDLVRDAFAPVLNGFVEDGTLTSWTWQAHVMGGAFTRLLVMDADSHTDLLHAYEQLGDQVDDGANEEFGELCPSHQDYLWNVRSSD